MLNLLYESHPAGTQVDGLPRAASWILEELHQFKIAGYIFLTPTKVTAWRMQNLSSIHMLGETCQSVQGFHGSGGKFEMTNFC